MQYLLPVLSRLILNFSSYAIYEYSNRVHSYLGAFPRSQFARRPLCIEARALLYAIKFCAVNILFVIAFLEEFNTKSKCDENWK